MSAEVKAALLALVGDAVAAGWSTRRAAHLLGVDTDRLARWRSRRPDGLDDATGGLALHGLLDWERAGANDLPPLLPRQGRGGLRHCGLKSGGAIKVVVSP